MPIVLPLPAPRQPRVLVWVAIVLGMAAIAWLSLVPARVSPAAPLVWWPVGVALAVMLRYGLRTLPALWLGLMAGMTLGMPAEPLLHMLSDSLPDLLVAGSVAVWGRWLLGQSQLPPWRQALPGLLEADQIGHLLRRVYQRHTALFQQYIPDSQLTAAQFVVLCSVRDNKGSSLADIVKATVIDQATIRGVVDRLKQRELVQVEHDRVKAIALAIGQASKQDIILVAGKGHEDYQIIGTDKRHYSDRETVAAALHTLMESFK